MRTAPSTALTKTLATFVANFGPLPERAERAARMMTANVIGLMVGSLDSAAAEIALKATDAASQPAQATLLGTRCKTSVTLAALAGGIAGHVEDFDDTHLLTVIHPGSAVVPAAMAVGEYLGKTYGAVLQAVGVGTEVCLRVGVGLGQWHFDRGWHITGTTGRLGAAASCGRLLGLDAVQISHALGIAATEAAGLQAAFGTMTKSYHAGKAAYDGVEAALLASAGFTAASDAIEGPRGLLMTMSKDRDHEVIVSDLGSRWEIEANAIKPYACGIVSHPVIDAGIELRERGLRSERVASVTLRTNPVVLDVMGKENPSSGLESKFSVYHCFAVGLHFGAGGVDEFSDAATRDSTVGHLRSLVTVSIDPSVARDECFAEVTDSGGNVWRHHVEHATASRDRPMTERQLIEKMARLMTPVLGEVHAQSFADLALNADASLPLAELVAQATPGAS